MCRSLCGHGGHRGAKRSPQRKGLVATLGTPVEKQRLAFRRTILSPSVKKERITLRPTIVAQSIQAFRIAWLAWLAWRKVSGKLGPITFLIPWLFGSFERSPFTFFKEDRQRWKKPRTDASDDGAWFITILQPAFGSLDAAVIRTSPNQTVNLASVVGSVLPPFAQRAKRAKFGSNGFDAIRGGSAEPEFRQKPSFTDFR